MNNARLAIGWVIGTTALLLYLGCMALQFDPTYPNALAHWLQSRSIMKKDLQDSYFVLLVLFLIVRWPEVRNNARQPGLWDRRPGVAQLIVGAMIGGAILLMWVTK